MAEVLAIVAIVFFAIGFFNLLEGWADIELPSSKEDDDDDSQNH